MLRAFRRQPIDRPNPVCISCTPPEQDGNLIAFSRHWKILLHPNQSGFGNLLIVCLRHAPSISDLTASEFSDFHATYSLVERAIETRLGASLLNVSCERNWAYRVESPEPPYLDGRPNPHVHWHVVPRYRQKVRFEGIEWDDPAFGDPFVWREKDIPLLVRQAIIERIRSCLEIAFLDSWPDDPTRSTQS
jgi:diadenosine tetraphosphate (Ap4A) HIT family hydrolase